MSDPTTLGGRYEIGDVLGRGGMAEVHAGRDVRLGRQVAVKMLRVDLARDPTFQARFRREAQSAASLNHPAVVAVYDTGEGVVDGNPVPYIVMEHVDGSTLRELLNSGRRLLPDRALEITLGVLDALDYSHRHGIVHRDIKPANVMLTRNGAVKVMDFGIARSVTDVSTTMTQTSAVVGTAQYLSPEQARGEAVDARSDLYSTGCLLYELLTGRPPFTGDSPVAVAIQHVREQPQPPSTVNPDVPATADAIVLKALAKDRAERYQSAAEMSADIERALAGRPVQAPAIAAMTQAMEPVRVAPVTTVLPQQDYVTSSFDRYEDPEPPRRTGLWVALGLVLLLLLVVGGLVLRSFAGDDDVKQTAVPSLVGKTQAQAQAALTASGFTLGTVTPTFSDQESGLVLDSDPKGGAAADEKSAVALTVSKGQDVVVVPTLIGLSLDSATAALTQARLTLGEIDRKDSTEPANQVLGAQPGTGKKVKAGSAVRLAVSSGDATVPDVQGQTAAQARAALEAAGFEVDAEDRESADIEAGTVIEVQPAAGQTLRQGSTVTIYVATAPPTPSPTPTPTPSETIVPPTDPPVTPLPTETLPVPPPAGG